MPRDARSRPLAELDLADELGPDPDGVGRVCSGHLDERGLGLHERPQRRDEAVEVDLAESRADPPRVLEPVVAGNADEQRSDAAGPAPDAWAIPADDDLLRSRDLQLQPLVG